MFCFTFLALDYIKTPLQQFCVNIWPHMLQSSQNTPSTSTLASKALRITWDQPLVLFCSAKQPAAKFRVTAVDRVIAWTGSYPTEMCLLLPFLCSVRLYILTMMWTARQILKLFVLQALRRSSSSWNEGANRRRFCVTFCVSWKKDFVINASLFSYRESFYVIRGCTK